jgi:hypothetical protein
LIVTGNAVERSPEAIRQERHRQKLEAMGVKAVEIQLGPLERQQLDEARKARGGLDGAYSVAEYLATLIRRDHDLLQQQLGQLDGRICEACRKPLPRGCGGVWASETSTCERARFDQALQL